MARLQIGEGAWDQDPRVIDEDVEAPEALQGVAYGGIDLFAARDIAANGARAAANPLNPRLRLLEGARYARGARLLGPGAEHHPDPCLAEGQGDVGAEAAACAGDDRHLPVQLAHLTPTLRQTRLPPGSALARGLPRRVACSAPGCDPAR